MTGPAPVEICLLGRFVALRNGIEIPQRAFAGRKVRTLVKLLASRQGRFVSNDVLADALWPGRLPADPVANLQVLVNRARRALGDASLIVTGRGGYTLVAGPACRVDTERFLAAVDGADPSSAVLREALAWWHGDPLPEEAYDDWAAEYRARLFRSRQRALEKAASSALEDGDADAAVEWASLAVEAEPLREVAVLLLVRALAASGDGSAALTTYEDYRRSLAHELGVDPSPEAAALHQRLLDRLPRRDERASRRRTTGFRELAFVGRAEELQQMHAAVTGPGRRGAVVLVQGVSGSGKSRLLDTLGRQVPLVRVRAYVSEMAEPWSLLRTLMREVLAHDMGYADGLSTTMTSALAWLLPELEGRGHEPDAESRRLLVQEVSARILADADIAVALDDLQWADPSSLGVVEATLRRTACPMVLAYRPEEVDDGGAVTTFIAHCPVTLRVNLGGLTAGELSEIVDDPDVVEAICRHTDRTPMAVTEVLRTLSAEGVVVVASDGHVGTRDPSAAERAAELARRGQRRAIASRVDRQSPRDQRVLELLALLAREGDARALADATRSTEPEVLDTLSRLLRRGLVRAGDQGWATSHDMVTEVVAARLDPAARAAHHADLARALVRVDDPATLAHHLREAGDSMGAATAYAQAARQALDGFADDESMHLADLGLTLRPPAATRSMLLETRGEARQRRGDIPGARQDLQDALSCCGPGPDHARILARLALLASGADDIVRASQLAELAVVEAGDNAAIRARALEVASVLDMNLQQPARAGQRASDALALYRRLGDAGGMARILDARAMAQFLDGQVAHGATALRRAADLFEDSGDLVRVVTPRSTGGHALVFAGRPDEGLVHITAALDLARNLGHAEGQTYSLWHRSEAEAALGKTDEAAADAAEALAIATRIGHRGWTATAWRSVGLAAQAGGDFDEALQAFRTSLDVADHLGLFASWAAARVALVMVARGTAEEARPFVRRALQEGPPLGHYEARWAAAEVAAALGEPGAARIAREAIEQMDTGGVVQGRDRLRQLASLTS